MRTSLEQSGAASAAIELRRLVNENDGRPPCILASHAVALGTPEMIAAFAACCKLFQPSSGLTGGKQSRIEVTGRYVRAVEARPKLSEGNATGGATSAGARWPSAA